MSQLSDYLAMGGYARFVWPAYGVCLLVLGALLVQSLRTYRWRQRELGRLQPERPRRRR
jgi:heme exporter protein D